MADLLKTQVIRKLKKLRKLNAPTRAMFRMFRMWGTPRAREELARVRKLMVPSPYLWASRPVGTAASSHRVCCAVRSGFGRPRGAPRWPEGERTPPGRTKLRLGCPVGTERRFWAFGGQLARRGDLAGWA